MSLKPTDKQELFSDKIERENKSMEYSGQWFELPFGALNTNHYYPGSLLFCCEVGAWIVTPQGFAVRCTGKV